MLFSWSEGPETRTLLPDPVLSAVELVSHSHAVAMPCKPGEAKARPGLGSNGLAIYSWAPGPFLVEKTDEENSANSIYSVGLWRLLERLVECARGLPRVGNNSKLCAGAVNGNTFPSKRYAKLVGRELN